MKRPSARNTLQFLLPLAGALALLTGGYGRLVPSVALTGGAEALFWRALTGAAIAAPACLLLLILASRRRRTETHRIVMGLLVAWPLAVTGNTFAAQDPLGAWLNWRGVAAALTGKQERPARDVEQAPDDATPGAPACALLPAVVSPYR